MSGETASSPRADKVSDDSGSLEFRRATATDIPVLAKLAQRIWRACYPGIVSTEQIEYMLARMYHVETIRGELNAGVYWELALLRDQPVGFLSITCEKPAAAKLNKLYLACEFHGRGMGRQMIERSCRVATELGASELWLQVNKRNERAIRAYQRAGFRISKSAVFEIGGGFVMDDYVMTRGGLLT
jgi:diamine N-acetyltransferase